MKKITSLIIVVFILGLNIIFIFSDKAKFSELENKTLAKTPVFSIESFIDGEFTDDVDSYVSDHFPFRNFFLTINSIFEQLLGKQEIGEVYISDDNYLIEKYENVNYQHLEDVVDVLNNFFDSNNEVDFTTMIVPNSIALNSELLPFGASYIDQNIIIEGLYHQLKSLNINLMKSFSQSNQQLYYRLDHHWTTFGALTAYQEYVKLNNLESNDNIELEVVSREFQGTLSSKAKIFYWPSDLIYAYKVENDLTVTYHTGDEVIGSDSLYQDSYLDTKDKYSYFLNANQPLIVIENNDLNNQKVLLVIKDSYANAMIPFLTNNYQKIIVVDPRFYNLSISDLIEDYQVTNGLLLYNLSNLGNDLGILRIK